MLCRPSFVELKDCTVILINSNKWRKKKKIKGAHFLSLFVGFFSVFRFFFSGSFGYLGFPTLWILWMLCDTLTSHLNFRSRIYADVFWILSIWHLIRLWLLIINLCVNVYHCLLFFSFSFLLLSLSLVLCVLCPSFFVCLSQLLLFLFCFLETRSSLQSLHSLLPCIFFSHLFCKHSPLPATTKML